MSNTDRWLARNLSRAGSRLFSILSGWEEGLEKGRQKRKGWLRVSRWLKLGVLGVLVAVLTSCKKPFTPVVSCYEPVALYPQITEVKADPNPVKGAKQIMVTARVEMTEPDQGDATIESVLCVVGSDTVQMQAEDGAFDGKVETARAMIPASLLTGDTSVIYVRSQDDNGMVGSRSIVITTD